MYFSVPKLNEDEVLVPGPMALWGRQRLPRSECHLYKMFKDLFLAVEQHNNIVVERIQSEVLCKIRSKAGEKKASTLKTS